MSNPNPDIAGSKIIARSRSLLTPADPVAVSGTTAKIINFMSQFNGYAIDLVIDNLDTVNQLKFQINQNDGTSSVITLAANSVFNASDVKAVMINILTGSTNWQVIANIVRAPLFV